MKHTINNLPVKNIRDLVKDSIYSYSKNNANYLINIRSLIYLTFCLTTFILGHYFLINSDLKISKSIYLVILLGYSYYQFQFILHETSHKTMFTNTKVNEFVGNLIGVLAGYDFKTYRVNHMKHHKFLGTDQDPEFGNFIHEENESKSKIFLLLKSLFFIDFLLLLKNLLLNNQKKGEKSFNAIYLSIPLYLFFMIIMYKNDISGLIYHVFILLLSVGSITFFLNRYRGLSEHPMGKTAEKSMYTKTNKNILFQFLFANFNFNYHIEHHIFPEISSYYYPSINKILDEKNILPKL